MMTFSLFTNKRQKDLNNKRDQLYRVAYSWCNDELLADDLVNETLYKALKKWHHIRDESSINVWLFKVLSNFWHDHLRKLKPTESIDDLVFIDHETPEQQLHQQEIIIQVRKAVSSLAMGQRQVLTLVDLEGFSYEEVATILDIPIGTVMSRLNRGRALLKEKLLQKQFIKMQNNSILEPDSKDYDDEHPKLRSVK